jgi:LysR family transcriptional regulator, hydrogen peroxide-inducible genes activator
MLSIQQIQYILQLAESGNFSRAAEACFVTQPTLSMQIKKAEDTLGFLIFDRDKQPLSITKLGEELIETLREINLYTTRVVQLSKKAKGTYIEELSIGIIPTISAYMVPALFNTWKKKLPQTRLHIKEMKTEDLLDSIDKRQIDYGILAGPVSGTNLSTQDLFTEELVAYLKNFSRKVVSPERLAEEKPWLLNGGNCLRSQMMRFCGINDGKEGEWNFEGGSMDVLVKMVDREGGYTLLPKNYAEQMKSYRGNYFTVRDNRNRVSPARSVIGIHTVRNTKQITIQKVVQVIKENFDINRKKNFSILDWK